MTAQRKPVVALVTDAIYPYHRGGKELRYFELSRRLTRYADVHVYTMNWWKGPRSRVQDSVTYHSLSPLFPLYTKGRRSVSEALLFSLACARLLFRRFDVVEADHMPYFQIFALRLVTSVRRKRLVVTWHEVWSRPYWREYLGPFGVLAWYVERLAMACRIRSSPLRRRPRRRCGPPWALARRSWRHRTASTWTPCGQRIPTPRPPTSWWSGGSCHTSASTCCSRRWPCCTPRACR